jgi:hypothetical protein
MIELYEHQKDAIALLRSGSVLYGGVGSGKTATALGYYMKEHQPKDIYVITTAKKRDSLDWEAEAAGFGISPTADNSRAGRLVVDSWNNISRYDDPELQGCFFVFDEQRVVGSGAWVKSFIRIARRNSWILLSATPGDTWMDYAPVFIANNYFKNLTQFKREHVVYAPYVKFPKIVRYLGVSTLERMRSEVLVEMPYLKHTTRIVNYLDVGYDRVRMRRAMRDRWHPFEERPIKDVGELYRVMRRIVNTDPSRLEMVKKLMEMHPRLVIFYNFDYELEILRTLKSEVNVAEWNGHKKEKVPPDDQNWVYLVQYQAGSEGWNCTSTDAMVLYSLTYSYRNHHQAQGRIDRLDTKFSDLYYYVLTSSAQIDRAILMALKNKKNFNERRFARNLG